jgi:hypothetical protein
MKVQMTEKYIRAVAKIGFHFFLKYFPEFKQVKRNPIARIRTCRLTTWYSKSSTGSKMSG